MHTRYYDFIQTTIDIAHAWICVCACRECLATYTVEVQELARMLLRLIAEGLELDGNTFLGDLSAGETEMAVNYYPPCPDPSLTLGLLPHCDRHLLTVLSQGDVSGLQAKYKGRWITVKPIPNAFVVNIAHQMEVRIKLCCIDGLQKTTTISTYCDAY